MSKSFSVLVVVTLFASASFRTTRAQSNQRTGTKQPTSREAGKPAPRRSADEDDLFPKAKPKVKAPDPAAADEGVASREEDPGSADEGGTKGRAAPSKTPAAAPPVRAGVARICLVTTRAQVSDGDAAQAAEAVRHTFNSFLTGPTIETVALAARLPSQAAEEARRSGCGYLLHTSLTHKKSGGGGLFGRAVSRVGSSVYIPGGSSVGGAVARSAATAGVYTAAELAGSIKAKDELVLDFRLEATDGARPPLARTDKAKAKADGEDLLTTLVERAADVIATAVMK